MERQPHEIVSLIGKATPGSMLEFGSWTDGTDTNDGAASLSAQAAVPFIFKEENLIIT